MYTRPRLTSLYSHLRLSLVRLSDPGRKQAYSFKPLSLSKFASTMALNGEGIISRTAQDAGEDEQLRLSNWENESWKEWPSKAQVNIRSISFCFLIQT